jgi:hypothetical protein
MDLTLKIALIAGASAIVGGLITGVIAPYIAWGIEKRRTKLNDRRERIREWRKQIQIKEFNRESFRQTTGYSTLRPYLSKKALAQMESETILIQNGGRVGGVNNLKPIIQDEISRIEKKWKLL